MDSRGVTGLEMRVEPDTMEDMLANGLKRTIGRGMKPGVGGSVLNLGCGEFRLPNDVWYYDLQAPDWIAPVLPFQSESVGIIHAYHFLEHLTGDDVKEMIAECDRVMKTGAVMNICVPYARSDLAFQDIDHKTFFTEESWETLLENPYYRTTKKKLSLQIRANFIAGIVGRNLAIFTQLEKKEN